MFIVMIQLQRIAMAQGSGVVTGYVRDLQTHQPLPGSSVFFVGTTLGASTDLNGRFLLTGVPVGSYTIKGSYIGYNSTESEIRISGGQTVNIDLLLQPVGVKGKEVVVTAQAAGQNAAINQQLSSDQIENVVSAAKIKELPDENAAESVGRLPGVFVVRSGGEGYEVAIRGLQPKYNEVTIDGITMGASDPNDRSADLSMISSDMLGGIEVKKTVTPDMDADVIGGVVNFDMREAQVKEPGVPELSVLVQAGVKNLSDALNKYNNYKYVGTIQDRLLEDRLGIFAQIEIERRNLTSNQLSASYDELNNTTTQYQTTGLSLFYIPRDRQRYNGALNLDYKLPEGSIRLINFVSSSKTNGQQESNDLSITNAGEQYWATSLSGIVNNIMNAVEFEDQLPIFRLEAKLSHTYSETRNPNNWWATFAQSAQGLTQFINQPNVNPQNVARAGSDSFSTAYLIQVGKNDSFARQRSLSGSLDLTTEFDFLDAIDLQIKFGGKYTHQTRSFVYDAYQSAILNGPGPLFMDNIIDQYFSFPMNTYNISMLNFIDPNSSFGSFLGGDYKMVAPLNFGMLSETVDLLQRNIQYLYENMHAYFYYRNDYPSTISNYSGYENHSAFYAMVTCNIGPQITLVPGIRYQNLQTAYTGVRGVMTTGGLFSYNHYDTTVTQDHGYWLPDVALRYKPLSWFDIRLSYTNTLAYPDYNAIIPKIDMNTNAIGWNNYSLSPSRSPNYDAYFSIYNNAIGLFTAGVFLKQIKDLIYPWSFYVSGARVTPYLPASLVPVYSPNATYEISTFINDSYKINDYGLELEWQTHLWYLPGPLSGLVVGVNYTHIFSKAQYPYTYLQSTGRIFQPIDTSFIDRLIDQPDNIVNLSLGFDYKEFSIRVAFLYQSNIFTGPNFWPQLRSYTPPYRRWDLAAKQGLPWFGVEVYADFNNINSANDISIIQGGGVPLSEQDYGMTADLGLRLNL